MNNLQLEKYLNMQYIKNIFSIMKNFFRNIWVFRRTLMQHYAWDYSGILLATRDALDDMIQYGMPHTLNGEKHIKDMKIARELCNRLLEGNELKFDYDMTFGEREMPYGTRGVKITTTPLFDFPRSTKHSSCLNQENEQFEMLMHILKRKLRYWWD